MESQGYKPAPIEFFHARMMELFHEYRQEKTDSSSVEITGTALNDIIAAAKMETYKKHDELKQPIFSLHSIEVKEYFIYFFAKQNDVLRFCAIASSLKEAWQKIGINENAKEWDLVDKIAFDKFSLLYIAFDKYFKQK